MEPYHQEILLPTDSSKRLPTHLSKKLAGDVK
jgi:hypothetical protein